MTAQEPHVASISSSRPLPWRQNSGFGSSALHIDLKKQLAQGELCSCAHQHHPDPYLTAMVLYWLPRQSATGAKSLPEENQDILLEFRELNAVLAE